MSQNKPKRNNVFHNQQNDSRPVFPYHVHNQANVGNPFINERGFIYFCILKLSFTFEVFTRVQVSVSIKAARNANIWLHAHYCR